MRTPPSRLGLAAAAASEVDAVDEVDEVDGARVGRLRALI